MLAAARTRGLDHVAAGLGPCQARAAALLRDHDLALVLEPLLLVRQEHRLLGRDRIGHVLRHDDAGQFHLFSQVDLAGLANRPEGDFLLGHHSFPSKMRRMRASICSVPRASGDEPLPDNTTLTATQETRFGIEFEMKGLGSVGSGTNYSLNTQLLPYIRPFNLND